MCITHRHYLNTQRSRIRLTEAILLCVISDFQVPNFAFFVVFKCKAFFLCVYIKTMQKTNDCLHKTSSTVYIIFTHSLFECLNGMQ